MTCRSFTLAFLLLALLFSRVGADVIANHITTVRGRTAELVTECAKEQDGRLRIAHAGGLWRIPQSELTKESQIALGLVAETGLLKSVDDMQTLQTNDGRKFENIRNCVVSPSGIRFIHSAGAATIRFSELSGGIKMRFGYDATKAAAYDQQVEANRERAEEELLSQFLSSGPPEEVRSNAIWVDSSSPATRIRVVRKVNRVEARTLAASSSGAWVWVAGHYRDDGTYVPGHYRTEPDSSIANNWSTEGNRNPVTGDLGDVTPAGSGYSSGSVHVRGYYRKDGTHVRSHSRSK